ncbi:hypothetical protein [Devosia sp. Naph2]
MTGIIETKATCDDQGNWRTIEVVRTRSGKGWIETVVTAPSNRAGERKAA